MPEPHPDDAPSQLQAELERERAARVDAEQRLRAHESRLELVSSLLRELGAGRSLEERTGATLESLGAALSPLRISYATLSDGGCLRVLQCRPGVTGESLEGLELELSLAPQLLADLRADAPIRIDACQSNDALLNLKDRLNEAAIGALLLLPLPRCGPFQSLLQCDSPEPHGWTQSELDTAQLATRALTMALRASETERGRRQAEESLRESERRFRQVTENLEDAFWLLDLANHRMISVSPSLEELFNTPGEELYETIEPLLELVHPEDEARLRRAIETLHEERKDEAYRFVPRENELRWIHMRSCPIQDERGETYRVAGVFRDISSRRWIEEAHKRFTAILEATPDFVAIFTEDGRLVYLNQSARRMIGLGTLARPSDYMILDFQSEEPQETGLEQAIQIASEHGSWTGEMFFRARDGRHFPISMSLLAHRSARGEIEYFSTISRDMSALKKIERERTRLAAIVASSQDAIIGLTTGGTVTSWNLGAAQIFGLPSTEAQGIPLDEILAKEDREDVTRALARIREKRTSTDIEYRVSLAEGSAPLEIAATLSPVLDKESGLTGIAMVARDVTRERQTKRELQRAKDAAEQANRAKTDFLANMSHEIRTPMNGVIGMVGLILDTQLSSEQREYANVVRNSGEALLNIINDILDFSKIEAGKLSLESTPFDLRIAVEEVAELLLNSAEHKGLEFVVRYRSDASRYLKGDVGRVRQVLTNLVNNAIKFTNSGHVLVTVERNDSAGTPSGLMVSVEDTGIGIEAWKIDELFDKFTQADASTTRKYGGTGLGLAICKQIVELMGGTIGATSTPGKGSRFWFTLDLPANENPERAASVATAALNGVRALVVDDNPANRLTLTEQMNQWGMHALSAASARAGLDLLRQAHLDGNPMEIVLCDDQMPEMDGLEMAQAIRTDERFTDLLLILISSMSALPKRRSALKSFDDYLRKPVRASELIERLGRLWGAATQRNTTRRFTRSLLASVATESSAASAARASASSEPRIRVLVAEDNIVNQKMAVRMLEKLGCHVDAAANGREALEMTEMFPYDLVFMDCQMPEMDGYEATASIRSRKDANSRIPIVALTANVMEGDRERCLSAGMDDYIAKPIKLSDFQLAIEAWRRPHTDHLADSASDHPAPIISAPTEQDPVVEASTLARLKELKRDGDPMFPARVISRFAEQVRSDLARLGDCVDQQNSAGVRQLAEALTRDCAAMGARRMGWFAQEIAASSPDAALDRALLDGLESELRRLDALAGRLASPTTKRAPRPEPPSS